MLDNPNWSDPYGAPEFFANDMELELVAPGLVRARILCREKGETILRCTLLLPEAVVSNNMKRTKAFMLATVDEAVAN